MEPSNAQARRIIVFPQSQRQQLSVLDWATLVERFVSHLRVKGRADETIHGHTYELGRYATWLADESRTWDAMTEVEIDVYAATREGMSFSSRASLITTTRLFYRWAKQKGYINHDPAAHLTTPTRPQGVPKSLTLDQVRSLLIYLDTHQAEGLRERRDRALLLTGLYSGMRAKELAKSVWNWFDLRGELIVIPISKMWRGRTIRMHPDLVPVLAVWGQAQGLGRGDNVPTFSIDGKPIVRDRVCKTTLRYAKLLDIPLTSHVLRHTFATWALRKSGNLYSVSKALGHARLAQTEVYLRGDPSDSDDAVNALPSPKDW